MAGIHWMLYSCMYMDDYLSLPQNFHHWDTEYRAQTHQAREITWLIRLFINMTRRGQIHQAPPHPPGLVRGRGRGREKKGETKKYIRLRRDTMFIFVYMLQLHIQSYLLHANQYLLRRKMHAPYCCRTWK